MPCRTTQAALERYKLKTILNDYADLDPAVLVGSQERADAIQGSGWFNVEISNVYYVISLTKVAIAGEPVQLVPEHCMKEVA